MAAVQGQGNRLPTAREPGAEGIPCERKSSAVGEGQAVYLQVPAPHPDLWKAGRRHGRNQGRAPKGPRSALQQGPPGPEELSNDKLGPSTTELNWIDSGNT